MLEWIEKVIYSIKYEEKNEIEGDFWLVSKNKLTIKIARIISIIIRAIFIVNLFFLTPTIKI